MRFDKMIRSYDFTKNEDEPYEYKKINGSTITFVFLYVDAILLLGENVGMLSSIKASKNFSMKDLGEATYELGKRICRNTSRRLLCLSQYRHHCQKVWHRELQKRFHIDETWSSNI